MLILSIQFENAIYSGFFFRFAPLNVAILNTTRNVAAIVSIMREFYWLESVQWAVWHAAINIGNNHAQTRFGEIQHV